MGADGAVKREWQIDGAEASLNPDVCARTPETGPISMPEGELLRLRIFVNTAPLTQHGRGIC